MSAVLQNWKYIIIIIITKLLYLGGQRGDFQKLFLCSEALHWIFEGFWEMFEGGIAFMCAEEFPLVLMRGEQFHQACAGGERGPPLRAAVPVYVVLKMLD